MVIKKNDKNLYSHEESEFMKFSGNLLSKRDNKEHIKQLGLLERTNNRRAKYWCARFRKEEETTNKPNQEIVTAHDAPEGFKKFIESLEGFTSWAKYGHTWTLEGGNPFRIGMRLMSVWDEWNHTLNRIAVPLDASPQERDAKMFALTREYAKKNND
jgi:hypothetical protein